MRSAPGRGSARPVLFLTALDGVHNRISGFNAGGDDYVGKPFSVGEVRVRLDALFRRTRPQPQRVEGMRLDPGEVLGTHRHPRGEAHSHGVPDPGRPCSPAGGRRRRRAVVAAGWPDGAMVSENTLDSYVRRVRVKLAAVESPVRVDTVRGVGFVLQ